MKKCVKCNGHKWILGMGGMKNKCSQCGGLGFTMEVNKDEDVENPKKTLITNPSRVNSKKVKINSVKVDI